MDAKNVSLLDLSSAQLRKAADIKDRIDALTKELGQILNGARSSGDETVVDNVGKRIMSAEGRRQIAEAARARWAKVRADKEGERMRSARRGIFTEEQQPEPKRAMSAAARKKIAAAARARRAKVRAEKLKA